MAALVFFRFELPEIKGRTLEQGEQEVHGRKVHAYDRSE